MLWNYVLLLRDADEVTDCKLHFYTACLTVFTADNELLYRSQGGDVIKFDVKSNTTQVLVDNKIFVSLSVTFGLVDKDK